MLKTQNKLLVTAFFCFVQLSLFAQFSVGARAGYSGTTVAVTATGTDETLDNTYLYSFNYALVANIGLGKYLSLQPEVAYMEKGGIYELPPIPFIPLPDVYFTVQYLEVPLLVKFTIGEGLLSAFAEAGPTFGYGLDNNLQVLNFNTPFDWGENGLQRLEIGATGGLGLQVNTAYGKLFVHGRYLYGFTDLEGVSEDLGGGLENIIGFNAGLGYLYTFGGASN